MAAETNDSVIEQNASCTMLYDGECKLCQTAVSVLSQNNAKGELQFVSYQSEEGQALLQAQGLSEEEAAEALIVIDTKNKTVYQGDAAVIQSGLMSQGMPYFGAKILKLLPAKLRSWAYGLIARNRKRIWG